MIPDLEGGPARRRTPPNVMIGGKPFAELYPHWQELCDYFQKAVAAEISSQRVPRSLIADENRFQSLVLDHVARQPGLRLTPQQVPDILPYLLDDLFGVGVIAPWLDDPAVEDIILDSWQAMDISKNGEKHRVSPTPWVDDQDVFRWMQRILRAQGRSLSENNPIENGRLHDGSRLVFLCPPVVATCSFAIRKHRAERLQRAAYQASGVAPAEFFAQMDTWVERRRNIIAAGATGSGKTTLLNYLGSLIDEWERILVVEDTPELQIPHLRAHGLAATAANLAPGEATRVDVRKLVETTLRMKPDRVIVGEARGAEAFDLIQAMNTGHSGGMSTLHANTPADAILRLEAMAAPANPNMPTWALQDSIGTAIDIIIQMKQRPKSSRRYVVEAAQVIHPSKLPLNEQHLLDECLEVRKGSIYVRPLWQWDREAERLVKVADELRVGGEYF